MSEHASGDEIQQLRGELEKLRAEVRRLRDEVEAEERAEAAVQRKRRRPRLRLIKGGGMVALIAGVVGRYWRETVAVTVASAATVGVLVWPPGIGPAPEEVRMPNSSRRTTPPATVATKPPAVTRSTRSTAGWEASVRPGTAAPTTTEAQDEDDATASSAPSVRKSPRGITVGPLSIPVTPVVVPSIPSLPPLPSLPTVTVPLPSSGCPVTIGPLATICIPTKR